MERRRQNPSSRPSSLMPQRHPQTLAFQLSPASRPRPDPSSSDGRQRKKVRFANVAGSHDLCGRQDGPICQADKTHRQVYDTKTSECKYFKKFWEESGHKFRSCKDSHQSIEQKISKEKDDMRLESDNVMAYKHVRGKFPFQKNTLRADQIPVTPSKLEQICDERSDVQHTHSEFNNKDTPQIDTGSCLPTIHVVTPIAQSSFEVAEISRNNERESGGIFSDKRSKLLKLAAQTASLETNELLQRRSDFIADILQRLGFNIMSMHKKESITQRKMCRRHNLLSSPDSKGHSENMLDYGSSDIDSFTTVKTLRTESPPHRGNGACEFIALPWACTQALPSFPDPGSEFPHNQLSNLLLEDVQFSEPHARGRSASATELSLKVHSSEYGHLEWEHMLSLALPDSIPNKFSSPCQIEEQSIVQYTKSSPFWQPDLCGPLEECISRSVGLGERSQKVAELFDTFDAELQVGVDQFPVKCTASSFSDLKCGILDHHCLGYLSSCPLNDNYGIVSSDADHSYLNSLPSTSEHSYELEWESLHDSDRELWPSVQYLQPHGGNLRAMLGFTSNEDTCNEQSSLMLVQGNPEHSMLDLSDLAFFGSRFTLDSIRKAYTLLPDGSRW